MDLKIKICGMAYPENIVGISGVMPDYMGFIFHAQSPRNALSLSAEALKGLPESVTPVGVFVNRPLDYILDRCDEYGIRTVQLHGNESPALCERLKTEGYIVWKAIGVDENIRWEDLNSYKNVVDMFVFDTKSPTHGGTGCKYDWDILRSYSLEIPFLLSGGISPGDEGLIKMFDHPMFSGIDLNSRFEVAPGMKDVTLLKNFIKELRNHE